MHTYNVTKLNRVLRVNSIYTLVYQKKSTEFIFPGESHNFWEAIIIDSGSAYLLVDDKGYKAEPGDIFFFGRNQNHIVWADNKSPLSFLTISFDMDFEEESFYEFCKFKITPEIKRIIKKIFDLRTKYFVGDYSSIDIKIKDDVPAAAIQLLSLYIEELMLTLYISGNSMVETSYVPLIKEKFDDQIFDKCIDFINKNLEQKITLDLLSKNIFASKSFIERLFKNKTGKAFSEYLLNYRMEKAYNILSGEKKSVSDVASSLGFSSIHYFSRCFKKTFGFPPSDLLKKS